MSDFRVSGIGEIKHVFDSMEKAAVSAAMRIVTRGQAVVEAEAKRQFTGSHPRGTSTTSSPGSPPDVVTGTLRRSITSDHPQVRPGGAAGRVYPTAVYARIQELGGRAGRNHSSVLPPRPYLSPAHDLAVRRLREIAVEEWRRVL